ncbi:MAG: helix-turn-helix domain-containing protein [Verrucomicrobia bacterium]|nr:helix-turn-helix domain-containing protein [Verrucomicrobiota bacterium]
MKSPSNSGLAALAAECLRRKLEVKNVNCRFFAKGESTRDEIITTHRFILILEGELRYTFDGAAKRLRAGTQFLVPAWVRRVWTTPQGTGCTITWCEFDDPTEEIHAFLQRRLSPSELAVERRASKSLLKLYRQPPDEWRTLHLEAALKVTLTRFLHHAQPPATTDRPVSASTIHPRVKEALRWAHEHFADRDALSRLIEVADLSPNYLRSLFLEATLCTPHEYVEHLRLRHARYLLRESHWQLKRIAAEVGYDDPLYFSRLYRRFWKHPPSEERQPAEKLTTSSRR